jgi:hypothetical protein
MELTDWHMWWKRRGREGVRAVLMDRWDPIGVADVPEAADEYDPYVGAIGERLRSQESADELAAYLTWVQVERMELTATDAAAANDLAVAKQLLSWYHQEMTTAD